MAYVSTQKNLNATLLERAAALASGFGKRVGDYRLYRQTLGELRGMSQRELDDLGMDAFDLGRVARDAVYGPKI